MYMINTGSYKFILIVICCLFATQMTGQDSYKFSINTLPFIKQLDFNEYYYINNDSINKGLLKIINDAKKEFKNRIPNKFEFVSWYYDYIAKKFEVQGEYDKALIYYQKSLTIKELSYDKTAIAVSFINIASVLSKKREFENSILFFNKSLNIYIELGNKSRIAYCYNRLGLVYFENNNYEKAVDLYIKALKIFEKLDDKKSIAAVYTNLGSVFFDQQDYDKAMDYYNHSLILMQEVGNKDIIAATLTNIGIIYNDQKKYDKSIECQIQAIKLYDEINGNLGKANCLINIGVVYNRTKHYDKAIDNYLKALEIHTTLKNKEGTIKCFTNIALSYARMKNFKKGFLFLEKVLTLAQEINNLELLKLTYGNLIDVCDSIRDYKTGFHYFRLWDKLNDSINKMNKFNLLAEMEAKYQNEKKQKEIEILSKEKEIQNISIERSRSISILLITIVILILILLLVLYRLYSLKLKASKSLSKKNVELEIINKKLLNSENALKELNSTKDKFFAIISHDIKNPLSAFRSITKALSTSFYKLSEQKKLAYLNDIYRSSENLNNLFQTLLQWATSQTGQLKMKPQEIDIGIIAYKAFVYLQDSAERKKIAIEIKIKPETYAYCDVNMISVVFINLLSNAIKFTNPGGSITITSSEINEKIVISISDNGIGMTKEDTDKLFKIEIDHKTIGTSEEKGSGLGLILCKEFVIKNGGDIWVESQLDKGSTFVFSLPKI